MRRGLLSLYQTASPWVRFSAYVRPWFLPVEAISPYLTEARRIVDIGCGYGLLANLLALHNPAWQILGIDHSEHRITQAMKTLSGRNNIAFQVGDATEFHIEADGYVMVDFLHHIPVQQQNRLLSRLHALLTPGGFVVILEVPDRPFIKAMLSRISDWILYPFDIKAQFRNPDEFIGILEHIGFHVLTFERPTGIFAGIGYACRKSSETGSL